MSNVADPKLKQARAEIEAVLERYDIAGVVALHNWHGGPEGDGRGECWLRIAGPSYSRMSGGPTEYRLRVKRADYPSAAAQAADVAASVNMLSMLGQMAAELAIPLLGLAERVGDQVGAVHTPGHH